MSHLNTRLVLLVYQLYEYFERYDKAYNIVEYLSGGNLTARCPYSEVEAAQIVSKILSAIKSMHDKGLWVSSQAILLLNLQQGLTKISVVAGFGFGSHSICPVSGKG